MTLTKHGWHLPCEIISAIILHVSHDADRMYTLWACCLLSHDWYSASIGLLYRSPHLSNRNFDKFTNTICPLRASHMRQIGLESLVHHLDMGQLAYESTNSMTARLLRRTRMNLEIFVAPAVSFSVSCLAPLSKCTKLTMLDLSRDFYDLSLSHLLKTIRGLPIKSLSLPRSAMRLDSRFLSSGPEEGPWPPLLKHLEITDWLPKDIIYWQDLFESLPDSLTSIAFEECYDWHPFWLLYYGNICDDGIESLRISLRREAGNFPISMLTKIFPNVTSITLPAPRLGLGPAYLPDDTLPEDQESQLEVLTLRKIPGLVRFEPFLPISFITDVVMSNKKLYKIILPEVYLKVGNDDIAADEVEDLEKKTASRAGDNPESGIYLV